MLPYDGQQAGQRRFYTLKRRLVASGSHV